MSKTAVVLNISTAQKNCDIAFIQQFYEPEINIE